MLFVLKTIRTVIFMLITSFLLAQLTISLAFLRRKEIELNIDRGPEKLIYDKFELDIRNEDRFNEAAYAYEAKRNSSFVDYIVEWDKGIYANITHIAEEAPVLDIPEWTVIFYTSTWFIFLVMLHLTISVVIFHLKMIKDWLLWTTWDYQYRFKKAYDRDLL